MKNGITVIKLGGHAMDDEGLLAAFASDLASLARDGICFVITHGGGPQINALLKRLAIGSEFVNGLRVTDAATLGAVEMALCGQVNKDITRRLLKHGVRAAGISGQDGALLRARLKDPALGRVGTIRAVDPAILHALIAASFTPVVAPLALDENDAPLNVNADTAAGAIAGALAADSFILISDVPGVLDGDGKLLAELRAPDIAALRQSGVICGGMIPKTECCLNALNKGAKHAIILDGRQPHSLARCLAEGKNPGTVIT